MLLAELRHTLWIPHWHPTPLNKLLGNHHKAGRRKRADRDMVMAYAHLSRLPQATGKRRIILEIILDKGMRKCDPDAYWKSLLDALQQAKLLVNDSDRWVVTDPPTYSRGRVWGTRVVLMDLPSTRETDDADARPD
jgi:hypothetical protein